MDFWLFDWPYKKYIKISTFNKKIQLWAPETNISQFLPPIMALTT